MRYDKIFELESKTFKSRGKKRVTKKQKYESSQIFPPPDLNAKGKKDGETRILYTGKSFFMVKDNRSLFKQIKGFKKI